MVRDSGHCVVLADIVRKDSEGCKDQGGSATVLFPWLLYSKTTGRSQPVNPNGCLRHAKETIPRSIDWEISLGQGR